MNTNPNFIFFGTSEFSTIILDELETAGFVPSVVITTEDKPAGRKMILTPPSTKVWAEKRGITVFQPKTLKEEKSTGITDQIKHLSNKPFDLFIVAAYGKIIPQTIIDIPTHGVLNVHPSLLPKLRGASPVESATMTEDETGVSIMLIDADMDHGPVLAQEKTQTMQWPEYFNTLENILGHQGGTMLAQVIPGWLSGEIKGTVQDHAAATFCNKITKEDGLLNLDDSAEINLRKIRAYNVWPKAYFFLEHGDIKTRIIVTEAHIENDSLIITKIIPEGKKEMKYEDFKRNLKI